VAPPQQQYELRLSREQAEEQTSIFHQQSFEGCDEWVRDVVQWLASFCLRLLSHLNELRHDVMLRLASPFPIVLEGGRFDAPV